ncbi:MAG: hypothetical protein GTO14_11315 [Anaerolineales bacterium]|nr:hypothetical protein [Anaerolineales bacterium]
MGRVHLNLVLASCILFILGACNFPDQSSPASLPATESPDQETSRESGGGEEPGAPSDRPQVEESGPLASPGEQFVTSVTSEGIGQIAIQVTLPENVRYSDGAGVVVLISTYFTPARGFQQEPDVNQLGLIGISYLWPGESDPSGARSEGTFDYGGEISMLALRDVIRFASGELPNQDGKTLPELVNLPVLTDQVGLYAFSHPGIAAVNVLALHGRELPSVGYFVGRENPTVDTLSSVELGYWGDDRKPIVNPLYQYPACYSPRGISMDYSSVRWDADYVEPRTGDVGRAYLDLNGSGAREESDFAFGAQIPRFYGKRYYSIELTRALLANGALSLDSWPADLATPAETGQIWPFHASVDRYPALASTAPDLKVMLVFARRDHVQPPRDKPHIHHAYDGFHRGASLWTRLNPDVTYIEWINSEFAAQYVEHAANSEPGDWMEANAWAYPDFRGASGIVALAGIAEMADRLHEENWGEDLEAVLSDYPAPEPG